jgi:hypothetical protein
MTRTSRCQLLERSNLGHRRVLRVTPLADRFDRPEWLGTERLPHKGVSAHARSLRYAPTQRSQLSNSVMYEAPNARDGV